MDCPGKTCQRDSPEGYSGWESGVGGGFLDGPPFQAVQRDRCRFEGSCKWTGLFGAARRETFHLDLSNGLF